ncbi:hypothetical protein BGZ83_000383, partial [Gryganskiella cystojenkinii]
MTSHRKDLGGGSSKSHSALVNAQKESRRVVTRAQAVSHRAKDDDSHNDMVQVELESIRLQKGSKAIATPASKSGASTNSISPQSTISFKKIKRQILTSP